MSEVATAVFVYGTLMPGQVRWPALAPFATGGRPATARGRLWDTGLGYPAACFDPGVWADAGAGGGAGAGAGGGAGEIPGVLVTIGPGSVAAALAVLDRIEGEGELFRRVDVVTSAGPAMSYEWLGPTEGFRPLSGGWGGWPGR